MSIFYFTEFDGKTRLPIRSKYNFDFIKYANARHLETTDKQIIFRAFLDENGVDYSKPTTCKPDLIQYFTPMTNAIINYINKYGYTIHTNYMSTAYLNSYVSYDQLVITQFDLIEYNDTQIRLIQDYYYTNVDKTSDIKYYTKYNFDFDSFSKYFNVWGTKLTVFTDFMIRAIYLSESLVGFYGYGITDSLKKYFMYIENLESYLIEYCVTSDLSYEYKYPDNIDYKSYGELNKDLLSDNIVVLKDHYLHYGQFEIRKFLYNVKSLSNFDLLQSALATVFNIKGENIASGFLYDYSDGKKYLVTCFHLMKYSSIINVIRGSFCYKNSYNNLNETITVTADFKVVGYDRSCDVLVGVYDPNLDYNLYNNNSKDVNNLLSLKLQNLYDLKIGEKISYIGNMGYDDTASLLSGTVIDNNYTGSFDVDCFGNPLSVLIESLTAGGFSGSPIFVGDMTTTDGNFKCLGMLNSTISNQRYTQAINARILVNVISNIIQIYDYFYEIYKGDIVSLNFIQRLGYPKFWFGTLGNYFNSVRSIKEYPGLKTMKYTGGYLIKDFIVGFNTVTNKFITNAIELGKINNIRINTPLLNSKMYRQYIDSSNMPIVIKSLLFFNAELSSFQKFYLGKYGNQVGLDTITYGFASISSVKNPDPSYLFPIISKYGNIKFEYFYFDGERYVSDTDVIISDDSLTLSSQFTRWST